MKTALFSGISLLLVAIKYQNRPALGKACIAAEHIAQLPPGGIQVGFRLVCQLLPGENHIVPVHNQTLFPGRGNGNLLGSRSVAGTHPVLRSADFPKLPAHDGFQLLVFQLQIPGQKLRRLLLLQAAFQVHILLHLVPGHVEARPVGAEHGIRGVLHIRLRIVVLLGNHRFRIVADLVAPQRQLQPTQPLGIGRHGLGIIPNLRRRNLTPKDGEIFHRLRRLHLTTHGSDIRNPPSDLLRGQGQFKIVPGFQQEGFRLHKPLAHRPIGGLPEVAAFRVLQVGFSHQKGDFHVRNGRAGEDAPVDFLCQMGQNQVLIAAVQHVRGAHRVEDQPGAPGEGLQQQMHLGIVAQRLKMPHTLHGIGDGLLVENPGILQGHIQAEPLLHQGPEDFQLHLAHDLHMNLPLLPKQMQLGLFLFQLAELGQRHRRVGSGRQRHPIGHHRLQQVGFSRRFRTQGLSRPGLGQAGHRRQRARGYFLRRGEFLPGVQPQLNDFLLHRLSLGIEIAQLSSGLQAAAGDLQPGQPVSLDIPGDFVHPGGKFCWIFPFRRISIQNFQ